MRTTLTTALLLISLSVSAQSKNNTLKYTLSKHNQQTIKGVEYTSLFGTGDTVIVTLTRRNHYSKAEPGDTVTTYVASINPRGKTFMYWCHNVDHWLYEDQLRRK